MKCHSRPIWDNLNFTGSNGIPYNTKGEQSKTFNMNFHKIANSLWLRSTSGNCLIQLLTRAGYSGLCPVWLEISPKDGDSTPSLGSLFQDLAMNKVQIFSLSLSGISCI